jgi:hypothetical protein
MKPWDVTSDNRGEELPDQRCPNCGVELNAATPISRDKRPRPNDLVVCYRCGAMMKYTELMILRVLTQVEFDELDEEYREQLLRASEFVLKNNPP